MKTDPHPKHTLRRSGGRVIAPGVRQYPEGIIGDNAALHRHINGEPLLHPEVPHGWLLEPGTPEFEDMIDHAFEDFSNILERQDSGG